MMMFAEVALKLHRHHIPQGVARPKVQQVMEIPGQSWYPPCKAVVDYVLAFLLLIVTAPIILMTAVLVKLTSAGPAFYSQLRLGKNGRSFRIHKIRTMAHKCEDRSGPQWSIPGDPRITSIGRFLRATHLDELPQLWNVLRGEMSLVGPRPERPEFVEVLERVIPNYRDRLLLRPGVTGLAQVQLPPDTNLSSVSHKLAFDLYYVRRFGLWLDLRILVCTAFQSLGTSSRVMHTIFRVPSEEAIERLRYSECDCEP